MELDYGVYLDKIYGGWLGKCIGGTIGARFEGQKQWVEIEPDKLFPETVPPNDDLDIPVLWLKVLEEKGAAVTGDDLAAAWLEHCWYPFNEYGMFRRNWRLGIHPPDSGRFTNQFYDTGMGCSIRSELWGYVFPGAPDLAARYAGVDGTLDHGAEAVGVEQMFAAMSSMAFFISDPRRLIEANRHYLLPGTPLARSVAAALRAYDEGFSLREARECFIVAGAHPEACDIHPNVPIILLALLYGRGDMQETLISALHCTYDADTTLATSGAFLGQILGARAIPESLRRPIGDDLVMGIDYHRPEMTLSALARDTARLGVLLAGECASGLHFMQAPPIAPLPETARFPRTSLSVRYDGLPAAAPGETVGVQIEVAGEVAEGTRLTVDVPAGWTAVPSVMHVGPNRRTVPVLLHADADVKVWPKKNLFMVRLDSKPPVEYTFGVAGTELWQFLGAYFDPEPADKASMLFFRWLNNHFVALDRPYLPEPEVDAPALYREWTRKLGQPALIPSYEHEIDLSRLVGLRGQYCAYLARTIVSPEEHEVVIIIGNSDAFRLYLNGELVGEADERLWWAPFNHEYRVRLREGPNHLLVKLLRRGDDFRFTLGLKPYIGMRKDWGLHCLDWHVDLADAMPVDLAPPASVPPAGEVTRKAGAAPRGRVRQTVKE